MAAYETRDAVSKLSEMDPELAEALKGDSLPSPMLKIPFSQAVAMSRATPDPDMPNTPTDFPLDLPMRDGRTSRARVFKPTAPSPSSSSPSPLIVYIHGGGFCIGNPSHVAVYARALSDLLHAVVVAPTYRLAPEHPFPAAPHDAWDAFAWLAQPSNAATLGADLTAGRGGLVIGGISAGANLAAVTAQRYVLERAAAAAGGAGPPLAGVLLTVPWLLEEEIVPAGAKELWFSRAQNADALVIDGRAVAFVRDAYAPDVRSPDFSPFNFARAHDGFPRTHVQVAGQDPLRDDGLVYERVLREHGVETRLDVYPGVPHGHAMVAPTLKSAVRCNLDILKGAAWVLGREVSDEEAGKALAAAAAVVAPPAGARVN